MMVERDASHSTGGTVDLSHHPAELPRFGIFSYVFLEVSGDDRRAVPARLDK